MTTVKVNHKELAYLIEESYEKKNPLFIWGTTGIGKSYICRETAKRLAKKHNREYTEDGIEDGKFVLVDRRISMFDPSDLKGLPDLSKSETVWKPPKWLPKKKDSMGIIFFDELNLAPQSVQSAAYQLILDRRLGEYALPDGWIIIAAGNRIEDANVYEMDPPLLNRFIHVELKTPSVKKWIKNFAVPHDLDIKISAFLSSERSLLMATPEQFSKKKVKAFPSPRSWEVCSKLIKGVEDMDKIELLASSAVGEAAGVEFVEFIKRKDKINIKEILRHPKKIKDLSSDPGDVYSVISSLAEMYRGQRKILPKVLKIGKYIEAEFRFVFLSLLKQQHKGHFKEKAVKLSKENPWILDLTDYLT